MRASRWAARGVAALVVLTLSSCQEETEPQLLDPQADADSSNEAGNETTGESEMMFALTAADAETATTDEELADAAATSTAAQWGGACVTSVIDRNVVTYTLTDCTGPFGFVTVSGILVATYTLSPEGVRAEIVGNDLTVNAGTASVTSSVLHRVDGSLHTLEIDTKWTGETAAGKPTSRTGDYVSTIDPDAGCITLDGNWDTSIGAVSWETIVSDFAVCSGECPADGGSIEWVGANSTTTVSYDGGRTATWENSKGRSGTVRLLCGR